MVSLICEQRLREELSDFYSNIDDQIIYKLKDLCAIHDLSEDIICSELLAFVLKYDRKQLNLELIDDFQTDFLDKRALNDYKKSKALTSKSNRVNPKPQLMNTSFNANKSFNSLLNYTNECQNETNVKTNATTIATTQIEIVSNEETDDMETDIQSQETPESPKVVEKVIPVDVCLDVSSQSSLLNIMEETIDSSLKFSQNSNILCYYGNSLSDLDWVNRSKVKPSVQHLEQSIALTENYKFMSLKIKESNEILNDIIDEFSEDFRKKYDIDSWSRFSIESPTKSYYIGRICHDVTKNKLEEQFVRFETSHYISDNESIGLDLSHLKSYSLFPGQVIACKAINESGKSLFVEEIIDFDKILGFPKAMPTLTHPLHLVVGVGPFNSPNSLGFEPLKKMMEYIKEHKPDFCILIGPFVDSQNESLMNTNESIDRLFNSQMRFICEQLIDVKTEAIVIPSTRDINVFNVLPTMPFNSYKSSKIHYFSNPTLININGVIIGLTATDVLLELSKSELSVGREGDRMSTLCKHILSQRCFYPIFPPNPEINLEFTKYDYLSLPVKPHILLLPSDLKEFIKSVCGSVVINSGRVSKSKFARIRVDPIEQKSCNGSLESYTNVEIIKVDI